SSPRGVIFWATFLAAPRGVHIHPRHSFRQHCCCCCSCRCCYCRCCFYLFTLKTFPINLKIAHHLGTPADKHTTCNVTSKPVRNAKKAYGTSRLTKYRAIL
ncbi:unnamed protein product, partial [Laminaria digitata]